MLVKESGLKPHEVATDLQMQADYVEVIAETMNLAAELAHEDRYMFVDGCEICLERKNLLSQL